MSIHIIGGGTLSHVRSHLAIAAPAFGETARRIHEHYAGVIIDGVVRGKGLSNRSTLHLTKMADHNSTLVTNDDVVVLVDKLIADPATRVIYFNVALCDFDAQIGDVPSGKYAERLQSRDGPFTMTLTMADKLIGRIRRERKDIFVVGFKTTSSATSDDQYRTALNMLKANSLNLVLANDLVTRNNMIVAPEETRYCETTDRKAVLMRLVEMVDARSKNTFTRSTVREGSLIAWDDDQLVPDNLRKVVNHLVARWAYKPFRGSTAGHFAVRFDERRVLTSRRKTDYTKPGGLDLVEVEYNGLDKVFAYGAKPSVGGQSQRIIFDEHPDLDVIVHAHIPLRENAPDIIPVASQWQAECGSHQCGANTSRNLASFDDGIHAVMLDNHGPNIVCSRDVDADKVIDFIERNFDVEAKTGGLVHADEYA